VQRTASFLSHTLWLERASYQASYQTSQKEDEADKEQSVSLLRDMKLGVPPVDEGMAIFVHAQPTSARIQKNADGLEQAGSVTNMDFAVNSQ
jgi:hypothetical protein